jgi:hydrogenase large subunit
MARISIDPVTRIEGHLRIDVEVDGGKVQKAWASCTMWRGLETILRGRDAREGWVFAQRFCGVCTTVHAIASVRAVEDALQLEIPVERAVHPQPDSHRPRPARPYHSLLSTVFSRLGGHHDHPQSGSLHGQRPSQKATATWPGNSRRELEAVQNKVKGHD